MTKQIFEYALPISGGFDSAVSHLVLQHSGIEDSKIFYYNVNYGQPYLEKEERAVNQIENWFGIRVHRININLLQEQLGSIPTVKDANVEGRNLLLMFIGAFYANKVILSAPEGDMHPWMKDKNEEFMKRCNEMFGYVMDRSITIYNPLADKTKTGWAQWVLSNSSEADINFLMSSTVSCYNPKLYHCGECKPCFRKWIQMVNIGYSKEDIEKVFNKKSYDIPRTPLAKDMINQYLGAMYQNDFKRYTVRRIEETFRALSKVL